jgi:hypothetical protein
MKTMYNIIFNLDTIIKILTRSSIPPLIKHNIVYYDILYYVNNTFIFIIIKNKYNKNGYFKTYQFM